MKQKLLPLLELFAVFCKVGAVTFGGGYSMYPILLREIAQKRGWLEDQEITDYFAVAQTLPGIIAVNTACFIGYRRNKVAGAAAAALGVITPSIVVICIIAVFYRMFSDNIWVNKAYRGINVAVGAILVTTLVKTAKKSVAGIAGAVIAAAAFVLCFIFDVPIIYIILGSIAAGLLLFRKAGAK